MRSLLRFPIFPMILAAASALSCATGTEGPVCGNGIIERGEECDREDIAGRTCTDLGFGRGVVTCGSFCTFSTVACFPACASECETQICRAVPREETIRESPLRQRRFVNPPTHGRR